VCWLTSRADQADMWNGNGKEVRITVVLASTDSRLVLSAKKAPPMRGLRCVMHKGRELATVPPSIPLDQTQCVVVPVPDTRTARAYLSPVPERQKATREPSRMAFDMNCRSESGSAHRHSNGIWVHLVPERPRRIGVDCAVLTLLQTRHS
jgi:hypothetical protein